MPAHCHCDFNSVWFFSILVYGSVVFGTPDINVTSNPEGNQKTNRNPLVQLSRNNSHETFEIPSCERERREESGRRENDEQPPNIPYHLYLRLEGLEKRLRHSLGNVHIREHRKTYVAK